ncbi:MAG: tetratricopeptide repeat protein [Sphingobacteriales bacterium]|nr:MAG: tetratricopeptide repeat protein [Sphingobacteriales bacterium]
MDIIKSFRFHFYLLMLLSLAVIGSSDTVFAQSKKNKDKKSKTEGADNKSRLSEADQQKVQKLFFDGLTANIKGNTEGAVLAFKQCLMLDPNHDAAMFELARIYFESQDQEQTLLYAEKAAKTDPDNKWYQALYAETLSVNSRFDEAAKIFETLTQKFPADYDYYFDWAYMLIQAGKYAEAIKVYDALEQKIGTLEDISIQKQKLYLRIGQFDNAVLELQKLSNAFPNDMRYLLTLGELYLSNNMPDKALEVYNNLLKVSPDNPYACLALSDYYYTQNNEEKFLEYLNKALASSELPINAKVQRLSPLVEQKSADPVGKTRIFNLIELVVKTHESEPLAHILYADLLYTYDQKAEALKEFTRASELDGSNFEVWYQMLILNYELQNFTQLAQLSSEVIELFPNQPYPYYFNGIANLQVKSYEKAVKSLKQGTLISVNDNNLTAQMYSLLGSVYNETKEYDKSDNSFEKALKLTPDDALILNNYSYFLALRGEHLDKAAEMSAKSNKSEPANSSFEDTFAWVLYKQKKYAEALTWIEKALVNSGTPNATLLEHYGDILYQLNEINKAVEQWKLSKDAGGNSGFLDKKINDRKLYE